MCRSTDEGEILNVYNQSKNDWNKMHLAFEDQFTFLEKYT